MALRITAVAALLVLFAYYGEATTYTVGDGKQWNLNVDYAAWASGKTFHVGDTLVFTYSAAAHNVLEVQQSAYSSCSTSNPIKQYTGGSTSIALTGQGTRYFICGIPGHCSGGMKVAVTVSAVTSISLAAQTPSSLTAPEPISAGNVSQMKNVLVLLFASLIMCVILS